MSSGIAADQLRLLIERVERLEEEKRSIADDIKGVYAEAKSNGYDVKTMRSIVRLRRMDPDDRREYEALLDLYKGALGMLDGTPLGKWAQDRTQRKGQDDKDAPPEPGSSDGANAGGIGGPDASQPAVTPEEARQQGGRAARAGQPVTSNPFPARDANRAAWDEGWCAAAGSDGMDIPEFLRPPTKKPKPPTDDADDAKDAA